MNLFTFRRREGACTLPFSHPARLFCTWFGIGLIPRASGTFGSLAALPLAYGIHVWFGPTGVLLAAVLLFFIGWAACSTYASHANQPDASEIVVDEVAGQFILLSALMPTWNAYLAAFVLFRFFDIVKPWPVSLVDRNMKSGLGVMLDDIAAGFYPVFLLLLFCIVAMALGKAEWVDVVVLWLNGQYAH